MKALLAIVLLATTSVPAAAATRAEAEAALTGARQAEAEAARSNNRWVPAETALTAAERAISAGAWDEAVLQAAKAHALASRAIEQSREQETAWRDAVIR